MKEAVLLVGGCIEFAEMYVRTIRERGLAAVILDNSPERVAALNGYKDANPDHFTHLVTEFASLASGDESIEGLFTEVNRLRLTYKFVGVLALQEKVVIQAAAVADYLGLPSIGLQAAAISRNKYAQREVMQGTPWGVSSRLVRIGELNPAELPASGVLKPVNEQGSFNVILWSTEEQRDEALAAVSPKNADQLFLVEEKIVGPEYSIECWVKNNEIVYASISQKETMVPVGLEYPVETGHHVHYDGLSEAVELQVQRMAAHVVEHGKVQNAVVHLEFKVDEQGMPRVMEWSVRNPGDRIFDLYLYAGIVNPYDLYVQIALGEEIKPAQRQKRRTFQRFLFLEEGAQIAEAYAGGTMVAWPGNSNYVGFVRNLDGVAYEEYPGITVFEVGVIVMPNTPAAAVTHSFNRHYYVVYACDHPVEEQTLAAMLFAKVLKRNTSQAIV